MDIESSRTTKMRVKSQLRIIHSLHEEYHEKPEAIKVAFKRIFIGENVPNDQVEDWLQKFLDTNKNTMYHQHRFYTTLSRPKQIISRDLDSSFITGHNEIVPNNSKLRFVEVNMHWTAASSAIINNMEDPGSEIEGSHFDIRVEGAKLEEVINETITSRYTSTDDFKNIKDTFSHMVQPTAQGPVYNHTL